jgi:hypothetical protein
MSGRRTAVKYPKPANEYQNAAAADSLDLGVRVGIISRVHQVAMMEPDSFRSIEKIAQLVLLRAASPSETERAAWRSSLSET